MHRFTPTLLALALLTACGSSENKDDATLKEAGKIHLEASEVQEHLEPLVDSLGTLKTTLASRTTPEAQAAVATIDSVMKRFEEWEESVVEVPGQEHAHEHAEGEEHHHHHHDHKPAPQVTASEMLDIQKELKANIDKLDGDVHRALEQARKAL